jgi:hypothetical protein
MLTERGTILIKISRPSKNIYLVTLSLIDVSLKEICILE